MTGATPPGSRRRAHLARGSLLLSLLCGLLCAACGGTGPFVWYHALPRSEWQRPNDYVIGVGDTVNIRVYEQENLSTRVKIRSDGKVEMPFVGEVQVSGKQPFVLAREVEQRLKAFIVAPRVTVNVEETAPVTITVMGEVGTRGAVTLQPPAELAQALAQAGGLNEFASESKIFVLRGKPQFQRIRFTYEAIVQNQGGAAMFPLRTGDVLIVE